jgi:serine/threonine-protein kinase
MGEVYKARDTRLDRIVAIKISQAKFNDRFEREARAISALNHPHICQLYDVGPHYLVMEYVEGKPLLGPLPISQALEYAAQICDALDAAHHKGIVHRDLKPGNILVAKSGVKILDFGLARMQENPSPDEATAMKPITQEGSVLGTLQYMSPEQLQGHEVDARSDIFSFGAVLYEMVSGKRAFDGSSPASVIAAVLERQPAPLELSPLLDRAIRACLEKEPDQRMQTARDARRALEWAAEPQLESEKKTAPRRSRLGMIAAAAVLTVIAALTSFGWWRATRPVAHGLTRLEVDLGPNISLAPLSPNGSAVVLSPDGRRLVYSASIAGGQPRLFTRRLDRVDQPKAIELPGTEGAIDAFFSPDSQQIGFFVAGQLRKISVEGGAVVRLADINLFGGADWGEDGSIVVSEPARGRGLLRVPGEGGSETVLAARGSDEVALAWPQFLPGGKALLFTSAGLGGNTIEVLTFADHRRKIVARGEASARYLPASDHEGYLVYTDKGTLFAIPFDLDKLETHGTAAPVLYDVAYTRNPEAGQFTYSPSGTLVYRKGSGTGLELTTIQWADAAGHRQPLQARPAAYQFPRFSPNGERLAVGELTGATADISVYDLKRDRSVQLTFGGGIYHMPVWTPDGRYIVFSSAGKGLWWTRGDGAGQPQQLFPSQDVLFPSSFTREGTLAYYKITNGKTEIWMVPLEENGGGLKAGTPEPFFKDAHSRTLPKFSPDDRWLAYAEESSGSFTFYVRPFPLASGQGGPWRISNGGVSPTDRLAWHGHEHELYYQSGGQIMAVSYTVQGDTFIREKPRVWISKLGGTDWDLEPNGKRVAVVTPVGSTEAAAQDHAVVFLQNFVDYLKQRVPLNK